MKSVLIIGLGRFGRHMATKLQENGHEVMAIDISEERADAAVGLIQQILIGDATDEKFMATIGVDQFDFAVVAIGDHFQTALEITVILEDLGCKFIVARAAKEVHRKLLLRNGADFVSYAEKEVAERLAIRFGANNIFDFIELTNGVGIFEIAVPEKWKGKNMIELSIRSQYKVSVLAMKEKGRIIPLPHPTHVFGKEDSIMVMGAEEDVLKLGE